MDLTKLLDLARGPGRPEGRGVDELLMSHVKQLKEIEERLAGIATKSVLYSVTIDVRQLRRDVQDMVRAAEKEHEEF